MAATLAGGAGLVRAFADFALLPDLLRIVPDGNGRERWPTLMREAGLNASHVLDPDIGSDDLAAYMADDAWQMSRRLGLIAAQPTGGLTAAGDQIARRSSIRRGTVSDDSGGDMFALRLLLGREVETYYDQTHGVRIVRRLREAVRSVSGIDSLWTRYAPGLLLAEFDFVLSELTRGESDWQRIVDTLQGTRDEVERLLGDPVARMRRRDSLNFADALTAFYWEGLPAATADRMTVTEARANAMLFSFSNILDQAAPLGPVQHLVHPRPAPLRLVRSEPDVPVRRGAILVGADEGVEWQPPITNEEAIVRLYGLTESDFRTNEEIYARLEIDRGTRADLNNPFPFDETERELHDGRWMDKALAMELLSSIALSAIDTPDQVRSFCIARDGRPNYFAPSGKLDVLAAYPATASTPAFAVAAEVSARRDMSIEDYKAQLRQGVTHAEELLNTDGAAFSVVYVLVANNRDICNNQAVWDAYREVVEETDVGSNDRIRLLPMYSKDLAYAAERVNDAYWDAPTRFGPDALAAVLHKQFVLLSSDEALDDPHGVRAIWDQVEDPGRFGGLLAPAAPDAPRQAPSGPSPN